ncbi:MAG: hypothetical protein R3293_23635, partial [Candidatus Promineifilaceae bacterium]|nr:hypothetical protein [Candidatus Promineifilaceae bacterium]
MSDDIGQSGSKSTQQRPIRLRTAVAIGTLVTIGISVFLLLGVVYQEVGTETAASYGLTLFFFLLPILAIAERASATTGRGGLYSLTRSSQSISISFAAGWLLLGGILFLISVFTWQGAAALQEILDRLFELQIDGLWPTILIMLIVLPRMLSRSEKQWKKRTYLVYAAILVLIVLIIGLRSTTIESPTAYVNITSGTLASITPILLISLWSLHFVVDHRDELRRPG